MSYTPPNGPDDHLDPATKHSLGYTVAVSALGAVVTVAFVLAALYPVTATGVGLLAVAGWYAVRTVRRYHRTRKRTGWTREVCVPKTGVCKEL